MDLFHLFLWICFLPFSTCSVPQEADLHGLASFLVSGFWLTLANSRRLESGRREQGDPDSLSSVCPIKCSHCPSCTRNTVGVRACQRGHWWPCWPGGEYRWATQMRNSAPKPGVWIWWLESRHFMGWLVTVIAACGYCGHCSLAFQLVLMKKPPAVTPASDGEKISILRYLKASLGKFPPNTETKQNNNP